MSTVANTATMFTPTGAAKKIAEEGAEMVAEQALKHTDDIIDAAKAIPNPAQVREEITAAGAVSKPPLPGVKTPKAPNAPPSADVVPGGELAHPFASGCFRPASDHRYHQSSTPAQGHQSRYSCRCAAGPGYRTSC